MSKGLTDVEGIRVGHVSDFEARTGCTVVLCEAGAVGGVDIRGSATGTQELDCLSPLHLTSAVHAVVFAGGSAFGLEAASGVRRYLAQKGVGFKTPAGPVPIIPSAIIFDLPFIKGHVRPTREMGEAAAAAATADAVREGAIGVGTGATVGKILGMSHAMKSGIGTHTVWLDGQAAGVRVAALSVVNALGDVRNPETGRLVAGARVSPSSMDLADGAAAMKRGRRAGFTGNTTLVVVATNARLSKVGATKLAQFGSLGVARAITPVWTMSDGDIVIALSLGSAQADIDVLGVAAAEAVGTSIVRAVEHAPSMGGLPGLAG